MENLEKQKSLYIEELRDKFIELSETKYPILKEDLFKYEEIGSWYLNTTLFLDFLGFEKEEFLDLVENQGFRVIFDRLKEKYQQVQKELNKLYLNVKWCSENSLLKQLLEALIERKFVYLDLIFYGAENELRKLVWFQEDSDDNKGFQDDFKKIDKILDDLNTKLYWLKTIDNPELLEKIYWKVYLALKDSTLKNWLNSEEKIVVSKFLKKIRPLIKFSKKSNQDIKENLEKQFFEDTSKSKLLKKSLPAEKAKKVFELVYDFYSKILGENLDYQVKIENRNSVSVNWHNLLLKDQDYTIEHIIKLIAHEVEKHSLKSFNMKKNFWKIQDAGYQEMEESTAVMFENYVLYGKLSFISPIVPLTTAGEIFDNPQDLQLFISGYLKLIWKYKENDEIKRFLRLKQFYTFNKAWVHRKWIVYSTGLPKVYEFIKTWDVKKLFLWAFSYETLKNIENIEQYFKKVVYPVLLAEVIKYILDNNLIDEIIAWKPIANKKLIKFLEEKYSKVGVNIREEIKRLNQFKRANKNKVPEIQKTTREILIEILEEIFSDWKLNL